MNCPLNPDQEIIPESVHVNRTMILDVYHIFGGGGGSGSCYARKRSMILSLDCV